MQYSLNNHYSWGWNGGKFNPPIVGGTFSTTIGSTTRVPQSFREECLTATSNLVGQFTKPIRVGLSGGSDSQVVCLSLIELGIPFEPVILRILGPKGGIRNAHDIQAAFAFCEAYKLVPVIEELNLQAFFRQHTADLSKANCFTNPHVLAQLHLVNKYKNTHAFIMAGGDPLLNYNPDVGQHCFVAHGPTPIQQFLVNNSIEGCTKFFMYSPELILSYLDHPVIRAFRKAYKTVVEGYTPLDFNSNWKVFSLFIKPLMYLDQWPELMIQPKYTGYENATDLTREGFAITTVSCLPFNPTENTAYVDVEDLVSHLTHGAGTPKTYFPTNRL